MNVQGLRDGFVRAFNTPVLHKKRWEWVDYLRGIAIVLVVYRHALLGIERSSVEVPRLLNDANMIFYSFRMPLFFLLSGIFISRSLSKRSFHDLVGIKFEKLLYPYLVWAFLQVTLQIALSDITNSKRTLIDYTHILYQPRHLDQFWYLAALFNASVLFLLFKKMGAKSWMQILIGMAFYIIFPYFTKISMLSDWMEFYIFFALGDALSQFFFRPSTQAFFRNPRSLLMIFPVFIVSQVFYLNYVISKGLDTDNTHTLTYAFLNNVSYQAWFLLIALIGCASMFMVAFRLQSLKILSFLRLLGYHSLYIYVMHVIVAAFTRIMLMKVFGLTNPLILLFLTILAGVTVPIVVYNLLIRNNVLWFLFSYKRKEKTQQSAQPQPAQVISMPEKKAEVATAQPAASRPYMR